MAGHPLGLIKASLLIVWTDSKKLPQLDCGLWLETYMHEIAIKEKEGMDLKKSGKGQMGGFRWRKRKKGRRKLYNYVMLSKNKRSNFKRLETVKEKYQLTYKREVIFLEKLESLETKK